VRFRMQAEPPPSQFSGVRESGVGGNATEASVLTSPFATGIVLLRQYYR